MSATRGWRRTFTRCAVVGTAAATLVLTSAPPPAVAATPLPLTARQIAERDQPAVQLIETDVAGELTYFTLNVNTSAIVTFAQNDSDIQNAGNAGNFGDVTRLMIAELTAHPDSYLGKASPVKVNDELVFEGSGFNVTPDGYVVTNSHVAVVSRDDAIQGFVNDTLDKVVTGLTSTLSGQLSGITFGGHALAIPADQQPAIKDIVFKFIGNTTQVGPITTTVFAGGGPTLDRNQVRKGQIARVVASGAVFPGKDVAILKIPGRDLPVLPIGTDSLLQTGDAVHAFGYPGDATFNPSAVASTVTADSTMTDGTVSNRLRSSAADYQIIENTATIDHGSSGGPLVNDQGQVVGITTASDASTDNKNGVNGGKFFFAVPSSVINEALGTNHVVPRTSPDQVLYNKALDLIGQSHFKAAVKDLRQAQADGYTTPYLQNRLDAATQAIAAGQDKPISTSPPLALIGGGALLVILIAVGVVFLLMWRRRKTSSRQLSGYPQAAAAGPPVWPSSPVRADSGPSWPPQPPQPTRPVQPTMPLQPPPHLQPPPQPPPPATPPPPQVPLPAWAEPRLVAPPIAAPAWAEARPPSASDAPEGSLQPPAPPASPQSPPARSERQPPPPVPDVVQQPSAWARSQPSPPERAATESAGATPDLAAPVHPTWPSPPPIPSVTPPFGAAPTRPNGFVEPSREATVVETVAPVSTVDTTNAPDDRSARAAAATVISSASMDPAWYADPTGRFQLRYWDGGSWSQHVSDNGVPGTDPI